MPFVYGHRKIVRDTVEESSDPSIRHIPLTRLFAIVDADDYEKFGKFTYHLNPQGYAARYFDKNGSVLLHREIMQVTDDTYLDHINGNTLDNRKANLRFCSPAQNCWNRKMGTTNTSGCVGVYFNKRNSTWYALIRVNGKSIRLGSFILKEDAIRARKEAEIKYYGEFAPKIPR